MLLPHFRNEETEAQRSKSAASGHTAGKEQSWEWSQVSLTPEPLILTVSLTRIFLSFWICRPVILDPADPTWDVGNGAAWRWDLLAREAESSYDQPCFLQAAGGAVQPWELSVSEGLPGPLGALPNLCAQGFLSVCCALGWVGCGTD